MTTPYPPAHLDTSVIVRYLTNDPPSMAAAAARLINSDRPLIVSALTLAESAYVLASVYGVPRDAIVDALSAFIQRRNIRLHHLTKPLALDALHLCRGSNRHSFADALLWAEARTDAGTIYTFDGRFPNTNVDVLKPE